MICQIEELRTELQVRPLGSRDYLKQREVETMESRARELAGRSPQRAVVGLSDGRSQWRAGEGGGGKPMIEIVHAPLDVLAGNHVGVATEPGSCAVVARHGARLATLYRQNPVHGPSAKHGVGDSRTVGEIASAAAHRQLINAAQVENIADIEIAKPGVSLNPKIRQPSRTTSPDCGAVQDVHRIGAALRPGKVR